MVQTMSAPATRPNLGSAVRDGMIMFVAPSALAAGFMAHTGAAPVIVAAALLPCAPTAAYAGRLVWSRLVAGAPRRAEEERTQRLDVRGAVLVGPAGGETAALLETGDGVVCLSGLWVKGQVAAGRVPRRMIEITRRGDVVTRVEAWGAPIPLADRLAKLPLLRRPRDGERVADSLNQLMPH